MVIDMGKTREFNDPQSIDGSPTTTHAGQLERNLCVRLVRPKGAVERCFKPGNRDRRRPDLTVHGSRQGRVGYVRLASNFPDSMFIREFDNRRGDGEQALDGLFGATFGGGELSRLRVLGWPIEAGGHERALLLSSERRGTRSSGARLHHCLFWEVD